MSVPGSNGQAWEQGLEKAAAFHCQKQHKEAEEVYLAILAKNQKHGEAHHRLGALLLDSVSGLSNFDAAKAHLQAAVNLDPRNARYRHSLGVAYQRKGDTVEAVECLERANEKDPMNVQILMDLGRLLKDAGRPHRAVEVYRSITQLEPNHPMAHFRAAALLRTLGRYEQSLVHFRQHLRLFPDHVEAKFWIAALSGDSSAAEVPPPRCIASLFDQYSEHFDQHLVMHLEYRTPQLLMSALLSAASSGVCISPPLAPPWARCIDLGVGTGLMGPLLRPHVQEHGLEGVDLSAGMVAKARTEQRGYDKLEVAELVQYLQEAALQMDKSTTSPCASANTGLHQTQYECVVAADVFVYLGNLKPVLSTAAAVSRQGALFAFSVEAGEHHSHNRAAESTVSPTRSSSSTLLDLNSSNACLQQQQCRPYSLLPTGRYVHTAQYLRSVLADTGWNVVVLEGGTIRNNGGRPVEGHMCVAVKV